MRCGVTSLRSCTLTPTATGFAIAGRPLDECVVPEVIATLGQVPIVPYATPSTEELPERMTPWVATHDALLLANHGAVTYADARRAIDRMESIEQAARSLLVAHLLGRVNRLSRDEVDRLMLLDPYGSRVRNPGCTITDPVPLGERAEDDQLGGRADRSRVSGRVGEPAHAGRRRARTDSTAGLGPLLETSAVQSFRSRSRSAVRSIAKTRGCRATPSISSSRRPVRLPRPCPRRRRVRARIRVAPGGARERALDPSLRGAQPDRRSRPRGRAHLSAEDRIAVLDSRLAGAALGLLCMEARARLERGAPLGEARDSGRADRGCHARLFLGLLARLPLSGWTVGARAGLRLSYRRGSAHSLP